VKKEVPNIDREAQREKADKIYKNREVYRRQGQTENTNSDHRGDTSDSDNAESRKDKQAPNLNKKKDEAQEVKE